MNKAMEKSNIAEKLKSGDKTAFEAFYRYKCDNAIAYLISAFGINKNDAYDITAAVFERLPAKVHYFRGGDFEKWFHTLLNNSARNYIKKESRSFPVDMKAMEQYLTSESLDFDSKNAFENEEPSRRLNQIINALPSKQREAVILHYFNGLTISQTAIRMNIKPETVKEHLSRAKKSISKKVKLEGDITHWLGGFAAFPPFLRKATESFVDIVNCPVLLSADTKAIIATTMAITVIGSNLPADPSYSNPIILESPVPFMEEQMIEPPAEENEYRPIRAAKVQVTVPVQSQPEETSDDANQARSKIKNKSVQVNTSGVLSNQPADNNSTFEGSQVDDAIPEKTKEPESILLDNNHPEIIYGIDESTPPLYGDNSHHIPPDVTIELSPQITPSEHPNRVGQILDPTKTISIHSAPRNISELGTAQGLISRDDPLRILPEQKIGDTISSDLSKNDISEEIQDEDELSTNTGSSLGKIPLEGGNRVQLGNPELEAENISEPADAAGYEQSNIDTELDNAELHTEESEPQHQQIENDEDHPTQ